MENFEFLNELQIGVERLIHSYGVLAMVTMFLRWVASLAAVLLMILDQTKWKYSNNILTSLLAPYLFCSLPQVIFQFLRMQLGKWIALFIVVLRLFLSNHFPESVEIPSATILLTVATPKFLVRTYRDELASYVCFLMSYALIRKHIEACGGYKNSFTQKDKIHYTICILLLVIYPVWSFLISLRFLLKI